MSLKEFLKQNKNKVLTIEIDGENFIWKRHAATGLNKSEKTLERAAAAGQIRQIEKERKIFYSISDLTEYEADTSAEIYKPAIAPETLETPSEAIALRSEPALNQMLGLFGGMFQEINAKLEKPAESELQKLSGKMFLDITEAASFTGLAKTYLLDLIHSAEKRDDLKRFKGEKGKAVWRCSDLDKLLENLPPVEIKTPAKKKGK